MIAKRRLFVNADKTKIVEEGSEEAAYLLAGEGSEVSDEDIEKYGLKKADVDKAPETVTTAPEGEAEAKAHAAAPENKAVSAPAETKMAAKGPTRASKGKK